ncbi:MAG TPA: M14 family metallopeptidase [Pirellulales bacterium]|nr:M14 family metallopeptidase [Pirellulales bacterium]
MIELSSRTIVGDHDGPHLLITAGVHGDEFEPMVAVRRLLGEFAARPLVGRVTLVPVVNEAAYRRGRRTAEDELDLARTCPGSDDGSVTQRTAAALSRLIRGADFYIDLHTGGALFDISPLAGYVLHGDSAVLECQRRMARAFDLPIRWGTSPQLEGRSLSVARDASVPAIYTEFGGGGGCRPEATAAYVEGCLNVAGLLGLIDRPVSASRERYVVEDHRPQSGYLQIQHPAPCDGFFESRVSLGQAVRCGEPLGRVVDAWGDSPIDVPAAHEGTVLFLRVQPPVQAGDPFAGLLPITAPGEVVLR